MIANLCSKLYRNVFPSQKVGPNFFKVFLTFFSVSFALPLYAASSNSTGGSALTNLSAETMLINIAQQVPSLMRMVTAIAYVLGMYFIFHGIVKLKHMGEMRTMTSHEHSIVTPIIFLSIGAFLLYLPSGVQVGLSTFWTQPNPYGYLQSEDQWSQFLNDCFLIIQLIGTISFIRGLVILSRLGSHSGQPVFAKGLIHIIGGILCINIYQFVQVIMATLGIQT